VAPGGMDEELSISFPVTLEIPLDAAHVHFINSAGEEVTTGSTTVAPTKCGSALTPPGSAANPAAAPGNLCVYAGAIEAANLASDKIKTSRREDRDGSFGRRRHPPVHRSSRRRLRDRDPGGHRRRRIGAIRPVAVSH
jgi:hypothetical protein